MLEMRRPDLEIAKVAVKTQLVLIGKAEQRYQVEQSRFGTIDDLMKAGLLTAKPDRNDYEFTEEAPGITTFKISAMTNNPAKAEWPKFYIDQTMQVVQIGGTNSDNIQLPPDTSPAPTGDPAAPDITPQLDKLKQLAQPGAAPTPAEKP